MNEKNIYQGVANTFTEKAKFTITVPVSWLPDRAPVKRTIIDRIFKGRAKEEPEIETERTFTISPCKVANMYRIAGASVGLPDEIKKGGLAEAVMPLITDHLPTITYLVAAGIQNDHNEPDPDLIQFIERNFDCEDLYSCLSPILENLGMQSFLNTIVLAKGTVKILSKTSPTDGSE